MIGLRFLVLALVCCVATSGWAAHLDSLSLAVAAEPAVRQAEAELPTRLRPSLPLFEPPDTHQPLAGRTLAVTADDQITLKPHEVILSFDDGPTTGRTESVLRILDAYGVKAVFMMVGKMAELHPQSARAVAIDGQTIGTHTYDHPNLTKLAPADAFAEVRHGQDAVAAVLAPVNVAPSPFFRFPYLASNWFLQATLTMGGTIALGVQIDSDDYLKDTPAQTLDRLLARLDKVGRGIVLFHDIHPKTVAVLPAFLDALAARGYTVVRLVAKTPSAFDAPLVTAGK